MREKNTGVFLELREFHHAKTLRLLKVCRKSKLYFVFPVHEEALS